MKRSKTKIVMHRYLGRSASGSYTYEITFNKSLEDTVRMDAMCSGLDRFDRMRPVWRIIHHFVAFPLTITRAKWAGRFYMYSRNRM